MASWKEMEDDDLYTVLQIEDGGPHVLQAIIRTAYRRRALELHPDKHRGDPITTKEFMKLQNAYDILNNKEARFSYDLMYEAKKEREKEKRRLSGKRQKMMHNLEKKENARNQDKKENGGHQEQKENAHNQEHKVKSEHEDYVARQLKEEITKTVIQRGGKFTFKDGTSVCAPSYKSKTQSYQPKNVNASDVQCDQHQPFNFAQPYQPPSWDSLPPNWGKARSYQPPS